MSAIEYLNPIQIALGYTHADLQGRTDIRLSVSGDPGGTLVRSIFAGDLLPIQSGTWWNDRGAVAAQSLPQLVADTLTEMEDEIGTLAVWEPEWDADFPGSLSIRRKFGGGTATLDFTHSDMTFDPSTIGLVPNTIYTVDPGHLLTSTHQPRRLWVPPVDRYPVEWRAFPDVRGSVWVNRHTREVRPRFHSAVRRRVLRVTDIPELLVLRSASEYAHHIAKRPGVRAGDPNVSLEALWVDRLKTTSPLRVWLNRNVLATYRDLPWSEPQIGPITSILTEGALAGTWDVTFNMLEPDE